MHISLHCIDMGVVVQWTRDHAQSPYIRLFLTRIYADTFDYSYFDRRDWTSLRVENTPPIGCDREMITFTHSPSPAVTCPRAKSLTSPSFVNNLQPSIFLPLSLALTQGFLYPIHQQQHRQRPQCRALNVAAWNGLTNSPRMRTKSLPSHKRFRIYAQSSAMFKP